MTIPSVAPSASAESPARQRFSLAGLLGAFLLAAVIAAANGMFWAWMNSPEVAPSWDSPIGGFAYSGFQRDQSPMADNFPSEQEIASDLRLLSKYTKRIRVYNSLDSDTIPALAREQGMTVMGGAWLTWHKDRNAKELKALVKLVRDNPNIERAVVGNETILRGDLNVDELSRYLDYVRHRSKVPISTAEPWNIWLKYPELAKHVDFITVHLLPYWEGVSRENAVAHVMRRYEEMRRAFPKKKIVVGEVGWPSNGYRVRMHSDVKAEPAMFSTASVEDQAVFLREFLPLAKQKKIDYYLMEAFDQPWKTVDEGLAGGYWGFFNAAREPKFPLDGPISPDAAWPTKALVASLVALLPILLFCYYFRRFKLGGKIFFSLLLQAASTLVVWLVTLPFEFYLNTLDSVMMIVLLPALGAMLLILLTNGFEFTEVVWRRGWMRDFKPEPLADDATQPFVSIHLPCHNEPPEMVIQTLASLARLDYRNFEVLVLDNNTKDEAVWKPVERYVANLGPRFRFVHLSNWPGFKAGALNYGLTVTDPRAEIVGVIDSDYVVDHNWLKVTVSHFTSPKVAVVQAPQAHRDWQNNQFQRMCSWEYDGFFRIGMHHRNERDAIIQHGTMTLVRKTALENTGRWSEWCICEDAELGLRLMHAGWETRYIDEVMGRGLTPSNFSGYKSQRFRWAFGAMQILKRRWDWLWSKDKTTGQGTQQTRTGLTAGQRFHFLTGWFSWFADALHLIFTLGSLAWSVGMIGFPEYFSLPLDLFLIPIVGFFALKAFFGPSLYRVRVPCGWMDVIGASVASMALSHAIARGIIAGIVQKQGTFVVTPKSWQKGSGRAWLAPVREETLMLVAIVLAVGATLNFLPAQYETWLWVTILGTQAIPYLSALACSIISVRASEHSPRALPKQGEAELALATVVPLNAPQTGLTAGEPAGHEEEYRIEA